MSHVLRFKLRDFPLGLRDIGKLHLELLDVPWNRPLSFQCVTQWGDEIRLLFQHDTNVHDTELARQVVAAHDGGKVLDDLEELREKRAAGLRLTVEEQHRLFDLLLAR